MGRQNVSFEELSEVDRISGNTLTVGIATTAQYKIHQLILPHMQNSIRLHR